MPGSDSWGIAHPSTPPLQLKLAELICGESVMLGAIDVATATMEKPEEVAGVVRRTLEHIGDADKLILSTNCRR